MGWTEEEDDEEYEDRKIREIVCERILARGKLGASRNVLGLCIAGDVSKNCCCVFKA